MIRLHELVAGVCKHCHAINPGPDSTCIPREGEVAAADAGQRVAAVNDFDSIAGRVAELATERQKEINR